MSTGQVFLTLGALVLLGYLSLGIQRMHVQATNTTVQTQYTTDALNFGRDISEDIQSYAFHYDELLAQYGGLNDVEDPAGRLEYTTQVGEVFYATVDISDTRELIHGESGRVATITVYREHNGNYRFVAEYTTVVTDLSGP